MGLMSIERAKKLLYSGEMHGIKNGNRWLVPKAELLRILGEQMEVA